MKRFTLADFLSESHKNTLNGVFCVGIYNFISGYVILSALTFKNEVNL